MAQKKDLGKSSTRINDFPNSQSPKQKYEGLYDVNAMGIALALTFGIVSVVCLLLLLAAPEFTLSLFGSFMHGIDLTSIAVTPTIGGKTLLGLIMAVVGGYVIGVIFAALYNKFAK